MSFSPNMLRDLKTLTLPWSTKLFVLLVLMVSAGVNIALFVMGVMNGRSDLLTATIQMFGVLLPIILLVAVLSRAESGVAGLRRRTEILYLSVIPSVLARICESPQPLYAPEPRRRPPRPGISAPVFTNAVHGECHADFVVLVPSAGIWKAVVFRLEVNVGRINFNLCVPRHLVSPALKRPAALVRRFAHTLEGAGAGRPDEGDDRLHTGYAFLKEPIARAIDGAPFVCLVGGKFVSREFLWDSAEQLYFAQDLMFMLRAFLAEAPELFADVGEGPSGPPALDQVRAVLKGDLGALRQ